MKNKLCSIKGVLVLSAYSDSFALENLKLPLLVVFLPLFVAEIPIVHIIVGLLFLVLGFFPVFFQLFLILLTIKVSSEGWILAKRYCLKLTIRKEKDD